MTNVLAEQVMDNIWWDGTPEGSSFWSPLYRKWKDSTDQAESQQLANLLKNKYGPGSSRGKKTTKQYSRAFKLIARYEERFGNFPSVELMKDLIE